MDQPEGMSSNIAPLLKGDDYSFWKIRMKGHVMALGFGVWKCVMKEYDASSYSSVDVDEKAYTNDAKALNAILNGLENQIFVKVMHCNTSK